MGRAANGGIAEKPGTWLIGELNDMHKILVYPLRFAAIRRRRVDRPLRTAMLLGVLLGICGALLSAMFLLVLQRFVPMERWGANAAAGLATMGKPVFLFMAIVYAPLFETFLGQVIPIELARRVGASHLTCVLLGGSVFGLGHFVNGGLVHGIAAFLSGIFFSLAYAALRAAGARASFLAAASAHATQNAMLLLILAPFFPGAV